jgi:ferrous iron transport protein A
MLTEYERRPIMNLLDVALGSEYIIDKIETDDRELDAFLFSLGCYSGVPITVVAKRRGGLTVSIKDGRYSIDLQLARAITVKE